MSYPYQDSSLKSSERVADLLKHMTLEEKVGQMIQLPAHDAEHVESLEAMNVGSYLHCTGDQPRELQERASKTRLAIPLIFGIDAIHGHCFENDATVFPTQLSASSSWDSDLMQRMGKVTALETRASGQHWTFSPVLCVGRDPRWGRVNETYGEDPWLIGEMASATIRGYQGEDFRNDDSILACAKHYVGYGDALGGRDSYEADSSKRKLLSLFLPPFEKVVKEANCASLMTGYHSIDGVPCTSNSWLLREVAKEQWGLKGFIVTDWDNVMSLHSKQKVAADIKEASYLALIGGNDMMMTTPDFYQSAIDLVNEGRIDESLIDDSVSRILLAKFELGLFDEQRFTPAERKQVLGSEAAWETALEASRKSMVLLKNDGILPLSASKLKRVLLVGPNADDVIAQLGDWSFGSMQAAAAHDYFHRHQTITPKAALEQYAASHGFAFDYVKGADCIDESFEQLELVRSKAAEADVVIACVGDTLKQNGEFHDRANLDLSGQQSAMIEAIHESGTPLVSVFVASKPLTIPRLNELSSALVCSFNPGCKGGQAIAELIFGDLNPSGKLTISFPHHVGQVPVYYNKFTGWHSMNEPEFNGEERYIDMPVTPLFAFGEGLSYSQFEYSTAKLTQNVIKSGQDVEVEVNLTNTSTIDGTEIVQVYINDVYSSVTTEVMNLRGFARVSLKAGEKKRVTIKVKFEDLSLVNAQLERVVEPGAFELFIGASSREQDLQCLAFDVIAD
ncbi:glycosyl hydrolase [Alginatibacterium sediminis]|uniref:beta-glucosidase n=1 Tax=Alginatibacterium sediminis TaxID=2164068 RepID=A0A420ED05_9ALTE|nr:glycoside hydrolase family 3 N-terminal domain-containing protein [Alginatibacterium sediminis]RKF18560.1 glycosyl hydrolase [Alginatibacterium sediminis]